jgi:uncharacterized protein (TIGR03435 family)
VRALFATVLTFAATAQPSPRFLSAEIHPTKNLRESRGRFLPNGDVAVLNTTLKELITVAYEAQEGTVFGASGWMETEHYDLTAKAPPNTPMNTLRLMLRPLLAEQFHLAVHSEQRTIPVLALALTKRSPMLKPSAAAGQENCAWSNPGAGELTCRNLTMADVTLQLPTWAKTKLPRPVIDRTGLSGRYDFHLTLREGGISPVLDQLGLKLEERQQAIPVIVVDRADRPAR